MLPTLTETECLEDKAYRIDYSLPTTTAPSLLSLDSASATAVQQYSRFFQKVNAHLDHRHPVAKQVNSIINQLLEVAGLPINSVTVSIYQSMHPDAFIFPHSGSAVISDKLLKVLNGRKDLLLAVLGHEIGHVLLRHEFRNRFTDENFDRLKDKVYHYEQEYQADRVSAILLNRLGYSPALLSEALTKIESFYREVDDKIDEIAEIEGSSWALNSHPFISRRIVALDRLSRFLPGNNKDSEDQDDVIIRSPKKKEFKTTAGTSLHLIVSDFDSEISEEKINKYFEDKYQRKFRNIYQLIEIIDCYWDEIQRENEKIFWDKESASDYEFLLITPKELVSMSNLMSFQPLDFLPEEVNCFDESSKEIRRWWDQAVSLSRSTSGLEDLENDISQYTPETCIKILKGLNIERFIKDIDSSDLDDITSPAEDAFYNSEYRIPEQLRFITPYLIKQAFGKEYSKQKLEEALKFLREFRINSGFFLPYHNTRIIINARKLFDNASNDQEKATLADLIRNYYQEITGGLFSNSQSFASYQLAEIDKWFLTQPEGEKKVMFAFSRAQFESDLEHEINNIKSQKPSKEDIKKFLTEKIPYNFKMSNWTTSSVDLLKNLEHSEDHDRAREADPNVAIRVMGQEEFNEAFYGKGRDNYRKSQYGVIDKSLEVLKNLRELWESSGFREELDQIKDEKEKLDFLLNTLRCKSTFRDQMIVEVLDWNNLVYVEDIVDVQGDISFCKDIETLTQLTETFSNDLLALSCSQRLWELKNTTPNFLDKIPSRVTQAYQELSGIPKHMINNELLTLISCFPNTSYVRDELLLPFIDSAPDEQTTLAFAALLSEPPPGVVKSRSTELVALSESLLDSIAKLHPIDKQELLLYLLGHKIFYSGIELHFANSEHGEGEFDEDEIMGRRKKALYKGETLREEIIETVRHKIINEDTGLTRWEGYSQLLESMDLTEKEIAENFMQEVKENQEYEYEPDETEIKETKDYMFIVRKPDSVILLSKASGVPVDMLFKHQRNLTTRQEQRDLLAFALLGPNGILKTEDSGEFLRAAAKTIITETKLQQRLDDKEKKGLEDLLSFALENCPQQKIPDLFLDSWYLTGEKEKSLPNLVAKLMQEYGSVLIKAGQYLSTQTTSLPSEWTKAFRKMNDQNRKADKTLLYEQVFSNYGKNSPFKFLGRKLGEGSIAAVYAGETNDGIPVAVKAIHPNVEREINDDIIFLDKIVQFINKNKDTYGVILPVNLAQVIKQQMSEEISLLKEVENNELLSRVLSKNIGNVRFRLPQPIKVHSNDRFLIMEMGEGISLDDKESIASLGFNGKEIRDSVGVEILRQVLREGVYQADPNLGNFRLTSEENQPVVSWLDTGNLGRLTLEDRELLQNLIQELSLRRKDSLPYMISNFLECPQEDRIKAQPIIQKWLESIELDGFTINDMEKLFIDLLDLCHDNRYVIKDRWVALLRTMGLIKPLLQDM